MLSYFLYAFYLIRHIFAIESNIEKNNQRKKTFNEKITKKKNLIYKTTLGPTEKGTGVNLFNKVPKAP